MNVRDEASPALAMLRDEIRTAAGCYGEQGPFQDAMFRVLERPGFALHPQASCRAGLLVLQIYRLVSGHMDPALLHAAAAAELHMQAAYLFDHLADRDPGPDDGVTPGQEMAIAIALLNCGQCALYEAAMDAGLAGPRLRALLSFTAECAGGCCAGQFLDAYLEQKPSATTDESLKMTSLKAGSLGRFATGLGAAMATDDPEIVRLCAEFGFNLFTYFQLADDLRDAAPAAGAAGDLAQNKKTLPVVFFHNQIAERNGSAVCSIIPPETGGGTAASAGLEFDSSGARVFGAIVAEVFLNRAKGNLADMKNRLGTVGNLESLVASIEINPEEVLATS